MSLQHVNNLVRPAELQDFWALWRCPLCGSMPSLRYYVAPMWYYVVPSLPCGTVWLHAILVVLCGSYVVHYYVMWFTTMWLLCGSPLCGPPPPPPPPPVNLHLNVSQAFVLDRPPPPSVY